MITFTVLSKDERYPGMTGYHDAPKLAAYAYMARLQANGHVTSTTWHADDAITVEAPGLETMSFAQATERVESDIERDRR